MADKLERISLRFNGNWTKYWPGDIAGFEPDLAKKLLGMKAVDAKGNESPLVTRAGSFLGRVGVVKSASEPAKSEPVGGNPEPAPVAKNSEELVSQPPKRRGRGRSS
jgi:hypothetical protein